ncbi:terminase family protein [uncultured Arcobacter sp.]|uniref:terminase large subunit domain-containing protein n=1 Tax=uncultured Arcobacter sp. TaxID=165434 RepID=UPI00260F6D93|nr:terminase family protein [uncultured Arcobacter sp.]
MDYTKIEDELIKERDEICTPLQANEVVSKTKAKENIGYFMYHQLGMTPYAWQYKAFREFRLQNKHQIWCTPRQYLGKSTALAIMALWAVVYNMFPIESKANITQIGIVSRTEEQSKKLLSDIRTFMYSGDDHISKITGGKVKKFFTNFISTKKEDANSKTELTFRDPISTKIIGKIICLPPTDRVRGYTFSQLYLDESAFFESDDFFMEIAFPTLSITKGKMVMTSTPNGQRGFFFKVFDPFEQFGDNPEFKRLWLHWTMIENPEHRAEIQKKKEMMYAIGEGKKFEQEYDASFTAAVNNYFDPEVVDDATDKSLQKWADYSKPCDMGVDFGMVNSNTVITISRLGDDKIARLIWHYVYPHGEDNSLVLDIKELIPKYNIQRVIVDDCPEGYHFIQRMVEEGINVKKMSFRGEKVKKYGQFRAKLSSGKIKFYKSDELISQMKALQEEETVRSTRISKPPSGSDDFIDSFVMSCYYFVDDNKKVKFYDNEGNVFGSD